MTFRPQTLRHALSVAAVIGTAAFAQGVTIKLSDALAALPKSLEWTSADLAFEATQRQLESAYAAAGLQFSGGGKFDYSQRVDVDAQANDTLVVNASANANVLPWSNAAAQIRLAERAVDRAKLDRADTRNSLAINAANLYFAARTADADLELAQANEALAISQLRVAEAQRSAGQVSQESLLGTQRNLENARANLVSAQGNRQVARQNLFNALGGGDTNTTLTDAPNESEMPKETVEALTAARLEKRSDVQKAISRLRDAEDTLGAAQLNRWLPPASFNIGVGQFTSGTQTGVSANAGLNIQTGVANVSASYPLVTPSLPANATQATTLTFSAQISVPFVSPSADANIASAETSLKNAKIALETTRRNAVLDIRQRYSEAVSAQVRVRAARASLQAARQSLETAKARNAAGTNTALDLESARINARQAERDLENSLANALIGSYRLQNATATLSLNPQGARP